MVKGLVRAGVSGMVLVLGSLPLRAATLFSDDFQQFPNGRVLTSTNYAPAAGASAKFERSSGSGYVVASNLQGSTRAYVNLPLGGSHKYTGTFPSRVSNDRVDISWTLWTQGTNANLNGFAVNILFGVSGSSVSYNPILFLLGDGQVYTFTNSPGASDWISIGNWGQYAGKVMTNRLVLDYPANRFTYSINGIALTNMPIAAYFTNVLDAVRLQWFDASSAGTGNRYALDDVLVDAPNVVTNALTHYVWADSPEPASPYTNWHGAAHSIQEAVSKAVDGGLVLVTNGVYPTSEILINNDVTVRSVGGPDVTTVDGGFPARTNRCFNLQWAEQAVVEGFTITGGAVDNESGGGVYAIGGGRVVNCRLVHNCSLRQLGGGLTLRRGSMAIRCLIAQNSATNNGGGGAELQTGGTLLNCLVVSNQASSAGGVFISNTGSVINCTISGNAADNSGGVATGAGGTLWDSIVCSNFAGGNPSDIDAWGPADIRGCCAPGLTGNGNVDADPGFLNAAAGDYRLRYGSPCCDAGLIDPGVTNDFDGVARPIDGNFDAIAALDIGCFEYDPGTTDSDGDAMPDAWEHDQGLAPGDATDATDDGDEDGLDNRGEYAADTDPWVSGSCLAITNFHVLPDSVEVGWKGGLWARQYLQVRNGLPGGTNDPWRTIHTNPPPTSGTLRFIHAGGTNAPRLYRLQAEREAEL